MSSEGRPRGPRARDGAGDDEGSSKSATLRDAAHGGVPGGAAGAASGATTDGAGSTGAGGAGQADSPLGMPRVATLLSNLEAMQDVMADHSSCTKRFLFTTAACAPAYPLVVGLAYFDVMNANRAAGVRMPLAQNLSKMVTLGSLHFFQVAFAVGTFYAADCVLRGAVGLPTDTVEAARAAARERGEWPLDDPRARVGPQVPRLHQPSAGFTLRDPNTTRTISGALAGGLVGGVMFRRNLRALGMGVALGACLGRFLMPVYEELPGVRREAEAVLQQEREAIRKGT